MKTFDLSVYSAETLVELAELLRAALVENSQLSDSLTWYLCPKCDDVQFDLIGDYLSSNNEHKATHNNITELLKQINVVIGDTAPIETKGLTLEQIQSIFNKYHA